MFNKTVFYMDVPEIYPEIMKNVLESTTYQKTLNIDPEKDNLNTYDDYVNYAIKIVSENPPLMMNSNRNYMATFTATSFTITLNNITFGIKFNARNGKVNYRVTIGFNVDSAIMLASDNCKTMLANGWKQMVSKGK
mgnify:CR=1 FL=1